MSNFAIGTLYLLLYKMIEMSSMRGIRKIIAFTIILTSLSSGLLAQADDYIPGFSPGIPVKGYVILDNGDTIQGDVIWRFKYVENNLNEIRFITRDGENYVFNAADIIGFGDQPKEWNKNNRIPHLLKIEDYLSLPSFKKEVPVFLHRIMEGRITVFQNRSSSLIPYSKVKMKNSIDGINFVFTPAKGLSIGEGYRTETRVVEYRSRFTSYYVRKDNGSLTMIDKKNYNEHFSSLFGDCPAVDQEIAKNPGMSEFKNFMLMAEIYNQLNINK